MDGSGYYGYQNSSPLPTKRMMGEETSSPRLSDDGSNHSVSPRAISSSRNRATRRPLPVYQQTYHHSDDSIHQQFRNSPPGRTRNWIGGNPGNPGNYGTPGNFSPGNRHFDPRQTPQGNEFAQAQAQAAWRYDGEDCYGNRSHVNQPDHGDMESPYRDYGYESRPMSAQSGGSCYSDGNEAGYFRPITRSRGASPYFSPPNSSPSQYSGMTSPGSPVWTDLPPTTAPHVEVMVTNLDYNISAREWKKILLTTFQQQVQVLNVYIQTQSDGSNMGVICVGSIDDARLAIAQFHRKKIGYKRIHVSLMKTESSAASASLRSEAIALLREANSNTLPLFKFIELFEKRFHKSVSVSELYKMKDTLSINDTEGSGRTVTLLQSSSNNSPTNSNPDSPENEMDDLFESPVCLLHCPEGSEFYMVALDCAGLPNVQMRLHGFAPQVHTLLHSHQGSLPLMSFPACYASEFGPVNAVQDGGGVPLEHLITCIPGIQVTISKGGVKKVHWSENKPSNNYDLGRFSQSPVLNQQLMQLSKEVVDLLKNSPQCRMPFSKFIPSYHHHFGRQCRVADYGYTKLAELFEAVPHVLQVMGTGNRGILTLTHRSQVKRFTTDLLRLLKAQVNKAMRAIEIPGQYQKVFNRPFDMTEYGVCYIEDMLTEIPESIAVVTGANEHMMIAIPRRDQTQEEYERTKQFCHQVIDLLRHSPQCTMPFNKFIPSYHHHFGRQCRVADYGFSKLMDLFEAIPNIVKLVDDGEEKLITLTDPERLKVLAEQIMALLNSMKDKSIPATELLTQFMKFHGHSLQLIDFNVENVITLMKKIKHVVRIDDNCGVTIIRLVDRSHIQHMAFNVLNMLMASPSGSMRVDLMREQYERQHGHPLDVSVINDEMKPYVTVYGSGDEQRVKLVTLMQFSRDIQSLLLQHHGRLPLHYFEDAYQEFFGVRLRPGAYGYPSVMALIQAIPQVVSVKGRGIKRTLYACNDFLERISHQIAYNPIVEFQKEVYPGPTVHINVSVEDLTDIGGFPRDIVTPPPGKLTPNRSYTFSPSSEPAADVNIDTRQQELTAALTGQGADVNNNVSTPVTTNSEVLQKAAQYLPLSKSPQAKPKQTYASAIMKGLGQQAEHSSLPVQLHHPPTTIHQQQLQPSQHTPQISQQQQPGLRPGTHFNFDFSDPGKALLAFISQKPEANQPVFSPFSPIDETHDHIKSVLALLSPMKPDEDVEPEVNPPFCLDTPKYGAGYKREPLVTQYNEGNRGDTNPRGYMNTGGTKSITETVIDDLTGEKDVEVRSVQKEKLAGRMDLSSLLAHLPSPRPKITDQSDDDSSDSQTSGFSPKRNAGQRPSKLVANFALQPEQERFN